MLLLRGQRNNIGALSAAGLKLHNQQKLNFRIKEKNYNNVPRISIRIIVDFFPIEHKLFEPETNDWE